MAEQEEVLQAALGALCNLTMNAQACKRLASSGRLKLLVQVPSASVCCFHRRAARCPATGRMRRRLTASSGDRMPQWHQMPVPCPGSCACSYSNCSAPRWLTSQQLGMSKM